MTSKKLLKSYGFELMEDYFHYIVLSHTNGQFQQMKDLISNLSKPQKKEFVLYLLSEENLITKREKKDILPELI